MLPQKQSSDVAFQGELHLFINETLDSRLPHYAETKILNFVTNEVKLTSLTHSSPTSSSKMSHLKKKNKESSSTVCKSDWWQIFALS